MKKTDSFFLFVIVCAILSTSCSATKSSSKKGGGWYKNRNVNQLDVKNHESIAHQTEDCINGQLTQLE